MSQTRDESGNKLLSWDTGENILHAGTLTYDSGRVLSHETTFYGTFFYAW
jgi:hypothetical protein